MLLHDQEYIPDGDASQTQWASCDQTHSLVRPWGAGKFSLKISSRRTPRQLHLIPIRHPPVAWLKLLDPADVHLKRSGPRNSAPYVPQDVICPSRGCPWDLGRRLQTIP